MFGIDLVGHVLLKTGEAEVLITNLMFALQKVVVDFKFLTAVAEILHKMLSPLQYLPSGSAMDFVVSVVLGMSVSIS